MNVGSSVNPKMRVREKKKKKLALDGHLRKCGEVNFIPFLIIPSLIRWTMREKGKIIYLFEFIFK